MHQEPLAKAAIVEWVDAFDGEDTWVFGDEYKIDPACPVTIGWVWPSEFEGYITLTSTYCVFKDKPNIYSNIIHVPAGMVRKITYIDNPAIIKPSKRRSR
jgi:hypothetical protein